MGWEDIAIGALAGGAGGYINSRIDDYEQEEAQLRKESDLRLRQMLDQENLQQRHKFAVDEADYRNRQANERADRNWNRSNSGAVDESGMPITREELNKIRESGGKYTSGALWNVQHRKQPVLKEQQLHDFYVKTYGPERGNELFLSSRSGNNNEQFLTGAKRRIDMLAKAGLPTSSLKLREMVSEDPNYLAYVAEQEKAAKGSPWNPLDNKKPEIMPADEWAKVNKPQLYAAAKEGDQIMQQVIGGQSAGGGVLSGSRTAKVESTEKGVKKIKSKADLESVRKILDPLKGMELERALQDARETFDKKSYQMILESLGLAPKKKSVLSKKMPSTNLGEVAGALTHGVGNAGKWAYRNLDKVGKQLTASELALLKLNNRVGNYVTDRFKEAYVK